MKWERKTIGDLCIKVTDGSHYSPKEMENGYFMASSKDMNENDFDLSQVKLISEADYTNLVQADCKPLKDDILIIKDGNSYLKYIFVVKEERELVVLSSIAILRPDSTVINPLFFQYLLRSPNTKEGMKNYISGSAIPRIVLKDFKRMIVEYPPLPTQRKIASILSAYDDLIENNLKRIKLLEEKAFLRYKGIVKSEKTEKVKLKEIAGVNKSTLKTTANLDKILYVDIASVSTGSIDSKTEYDLKDAPGRARRILKHEDIIWSCVRPNRKSYSFVWQPESNLIASTGFAVISAKKIPATYLYQLTIADEFVTYLENHAKGATYPAVTASDFEEAILHIPSIEIMREYENEICQCFELKHILQKQNAKLREARDILLPRLMSGEVEV